MSETQFWSNDHRVDSSEVEYVDPLETWLDELKEVPVVDGALSFDEASIANGIRKAGEK